MSANRKRHRVVTRPKIRSRQLKQRAAILAIGALSLVAALSARQAKLELPAWRSVSAALAPEGSAVLEGAPPEWESRLLACLSETREDVGARIALLERRFPFIKSVKAERLWLKKKMRFRLEMRKAVARVAGGGERLSDDGVVFQGPESLYPEPLPVAELEGPGAAKAAELGALLTEIAKSGGTPAPILGARYSSAQQAWELRFEDGTEVVWGELSWTREKLDRLAQVLEDSRRRDPALAKASVDMRYFSDGRILVKNLAIAPMKPAQRAPR